jgi:two-component system, chemotaxis family, response regulator Rcp1
VAADGVDALTFLRQEGEHANAPRPDFILLDLEMPRMNGREVLTVIKRDAALKTIPTAILTVSEEDIDVETSYSLQANCYLKKPLDFIESKSLVRAINQFWLTMVTLPTAGSDQGLSELRRGKVHPAFRPLTSSQRGCMGDVKY